MRPVLVFRHVLHEGMGTIADALVRQRLPCKIVDVFAAPLPKFEPQLYSGLVVMGGPMNVDEVDRYPALADEGRWLQQAVEARLPVLGVCLGSQLLAKALGSRVYANRVKEIGWYEVELLPAMKEDKLFRNIAPIVDATAEPQAETRGITVFQWHGDTFDLPRGAVQIAQCAMRKSGISLRRGGLRATISHGSYGGDHR